MSCKHFNYDLFNLFIEIEKFILLFMSKCIKFFKISATIKKLFTIRLLFHVIMVLSKKLKG